VIFFDLMNLTFLIFFFDFLDFLDFLDFFFVFFIFRESIPINKLLINIVSCNWRRSIIFS